MEVIEAAADAAEQFHSAEAKRDGQKMLKIVESFLRAKKRLLYGGFAINAVLPAKDKFYDSEKELPDYDFLTPDPLTDIADLMNRFQTAGYEGIEPTIGIHEGTYNFFVNFQKVADITHCDQFLYDSLHAESVSRDGLHLCPVNYLRMNMYLELSHPAGDVSRWSKVYSRLLLLNNAFPITACDLTTAKTATAIAAGSPTEILNGSQKIALHKATLHHATSNNDVLLGISDLEWIYTHPRKSLRSRAFSRQISRAPFQVFLLSENPTESATALKTAWEGLLGTELSLKSEKALGELLPAHTDIYWKNTHLGSVFETVACHGLYKVPLGSKQVRIASLDTLLNFYFAFYYAKMHVGNFAIICLCQELVEIAAKVRAGKMKSWPFPLFAIECVGYQPTFAELKKSHRERIKRERELKKRQAAFTRSVKAASARLKSAKQTRRRTKTSSAKTRKSGLSATRKAVRSKQGSSASSPR